MLALAIKHIYPEIDFRRDCDLYNAGDGSASIIKEWRYSMPQPTAQQIADAALPATKDQRIKAINSECRARLLARFGDPAEQISRSIGIYGAAEKTALETGIAATIDASNTASNAVLAAADIAAVEAVTVAWPVI